MDYVLVKFCADWADEMDVEGFAVFEKNDWESQVEKFKNAESYNGFWFGTNEGFERDEIGKHWLGHYEVKDLTDVEYESLKNLFSSQYRSSISFGKFAYLIDLIDEESE